MKRTFYFLIAVAMATGNLFAQSPYIFDAGRWAGLKTFGGTARYMAIGGAGVALGADLGTAQVNPAGLGLCRRSVFSFSPDFGSNTTELTYGDQSSSDSKGSFGFDNLGAIFCGAKSDASDDDWKGGSFAVNLSRVATFHDRISMKGLNQNSSLIDYLANSATANGLGYDEEYNPLDLNAMAYDAYLLEYQDNPGSIPDYFYNLVANDDVIQQEDYITTRGRIWQMDFAYGANYKDFLYLGAGIGVTNLRYQSERTYTETVGILFNGEFLASTDTLNYFSMDDYVKVNGSGINLKAGLIAKPSDYFRVGLNLQTPTYYYAMKDNYSTSLYAEFDGFTTIGSQTLTSYQNSTPEGEFRYTYTAPPRVSFGAAIFADKTGFISGEVEYIPYNFSSFSATGNAKSYFNTINKDIREAYGTALNYKVGAEMRLSNFKLRGGMNIIGDPAKTENAIKQHLYQYSGGFGFKLENMNIDLAVVHGRRKGVYAPYSLGALTPEATTVMKQTNFVITTSFFFD